MLDGGADSYQQGRSFINVKQEIRGPFPHEPGQNTGCWDDGFQKLLNGWPLAQVCQSLEDAPSLPTGT